MDVHAHTRVRTQSLMDRLLLTDRDSRLGGGRGQKVSIHRRRTNCASACELGSSYLQMHKHTRANACVHACLHA